VWHGCHDELAVGQLIWSIIAAIAGFGMVGVVFYFWLAGRNDRFDEEEARRFYDEHGHWPDEAA
jgi:hypothetical protein